VDNDIDPLIPDVPELYVVIEISPLDVFEDLPLLMVIEPPEPTSELDEMEPADNKIFPPGPLLLDPTVIDIDPPTPDAAVPVPKSNDPLLPLLDDPVLSDNIPLVPTVALPVLNTNLPLTPDVPAFGVVSIILPLDVPSDDPEVTVTAPPDSVIADPALSVMLPP